MLGLGMATDFIDSLLSPEQQAEAREGARVSQAMHTGLVFDPTIQGYDEVAGMPLGGNRFVTQEDIDQWIEDGLVSEGATVHSVGTQGSDPFNDDSENGNRQKKEEESGIPPVTLTAPPGNLQAGQWFNPLARQEYTAPAAQDWSGWMFGSPFGEQGGLLYQPWSAEYGQQYVPSNIWNWNPMEMSKATAFAPPIASTGILGDSASVANTTANNNNNTVVTTDPAEGGGTGPMAGDVPTHPLFGEGLTPAEIAILASSGYAIGDSLSSDMGEAGEPVGGAEEGQGFYE